MSNRVGLRLWSLLADEKLEFVEDRRGRNYYQPGAVESGQPGRTDETTTLRRTPFGRPGRPVRIVVTGRVMSGAKGNLIFFLRRSRSRGRTGRARDATGHRTSSDGSRGRSGACSSSTSATGAEGWRTLTPPARCLLVGAGLLLTAFSTGAGRR